MASPPIGSGEPWRRSGPVPRVLTATQRRLLLLVVAAAALALAATVGVGWRLERNEHSPLVRVGEPAPDFTLTASDGGSVTLRDQRGHPLLLAFLPSVQCGVCQQRLRALREALPRLTEQGVTLYVISTDEPEVQRTVARSLHLGFPLLAENVIVDRHPAGRAYGVFHEPGAQQGPVDAAALVLIDAGGSVRALDNRPAGELSAADLVRFVADGLANSGAAR